MTLLKGVGVLVSLGIVTFLVDRGLVLVGGSWAAAALGVGMIALALAVAAFFLLSQPGKRLADEIYARMVDPRSDDD